MRDFANWLAGTGASNAIQSHYWVIPTVQTIHIIALAVLVGSVFIVCLRILGAIRQDQPVWAVVDRFAPWMWGALVVLLLSGLILIVGEPARELLSFSFWLKMALLVSVLVLTVSFHRRVRAVSDDAEAEQQVARRLRKPAVLALVLWAAIIVLGRLIAWDGQIWGGLSPQSALAPVPEAEAPRLASSSDAGPAPVAREVG